MTVSVTGARRILFILSGLALSGIALAWWLGGTLAGYPDPRTGYSAFYVIFARDEILGLAVVAVFGVAAALLLFGKCNRHDQSREISGAAPRKYLLVIAIAAVVFAIAALGTHFVCHDYALSADEFMADFQAQIFLRGEVTAEVPPQWVDAVRIIRPTYVDYFPATHRWKATYLPVYAAMRALFQSVYLQALLNPVLAALTILALYGTVRNIWPNEKQNAFLAVLLLAGSAQFLVMAMTAYSMPAHLALNTAWLWLYSRPDLRRFYLAPVIGVLAIGLHQPIVHALFVAPFLWRLVWERKWRAVWSYGLIYLLGCAVWDAWRVHYLPPAAGDTISVFRLINLRMFVIQPMDLLLVLGWSCLPTPFLAAVGFRHIFREQPIVQDAALSCLLTFGFYYFFYLDQGHGWGYRYFHGALACLVIVAVAGWQALAQSIEPRQLRNFVVVGVALSLLIQLPLRCYQAETFIRPFARASEMIHSTPVQVVALDPHDAWYSADLVRNNPFLEDSPVVAALIRLRQPEVSVLRQARSARIITRSELGALGLSIVPAAHYRCDPFRLGLGK